jgi:hypothetical protein
LHDIVPQGDSDEFLVGDVPRFWSELRERHEVHELVEDWQQGRFGIGAIRL